MAHHRSLLGNPRVGSNPIRMLVLCGHSHDQVRAAHDESHDETRKARQEMNAWFMHWVVNDFYTPVWPNIAASAVVGTILWFKLHAIHKHLRGKSK